jgi:hypothetical protein
MKERDENGVGAAWEMREAAAGFLETRAGGRAARARAKRERSESARREKGGWAGVLFGLAPSPEVNIMARLSRAACPPSPGRAR